MWPETVWLLNDQCSFDTPGSPSSVEEWVAYCLPDHDTRRAYYVMRYRLSRWETDNSELLNELLGVINIAMQWNYLVKCRCNLTFALLGYTEGQSYRILACLPHIQHDVSFQKYHPEVYPHGSYYTIRRSHAKAKPIIKPKQVYGKGRTRR